MNCPLPICFWLQKCETHYFPCKVRLPQSSSFHNCRCIRYFIHFPKFSCDDYINADFSNEGSKYRNLSTCVTDLLDVANCVLLEKMVYRKWARSKYHRFVVFFFFLHAINRKSCLWCLLWEVTHKLSIFKFPVWSKKKKKKKKKKKTGALHRRGERRLFTTMWPLGATSWLAPKSVMA